MQTLLDYLEQLLGDGRLLLGGDQVNVADCTMQSSLQFMRFVEADVFGDRPLLRAWTNATAWWLRKLYPGGDGRSCAETEFLRGLGLENKNVAHFQFYSADCSSLRATKYRFYLCR